MNLYTAHEWLHLGLICLFALGGLLEIMSVGKERKPVTGGTAAIVVLVQAFIIAALIVWWPE